MRKMSLICVVLALLVFCSVASAGRRCGGGRSRGGRSGGTVAIYASGGGGCYSSGSVVTYSAPVVTYTQVVGVPSTVSCGPFSMSWSSGGCSGGNCGSRQHR